ncbi:hypothetical protein OCGS_1424 [Oceaniovalibus guishaninsula JLT2003]|uniref:Phosphatidate phosphatase APP1 catalytic domain-containing protein n=1 Tax=Oceaniovalibus guishaninsula JLT2003 TaxID=1231392 RepID=K2GPK3_9RHOB|nr:phosphatase domain-containing protein [Oceaniovalibus guishaninsula]EKE44586.1 hypothetical protein OCGS_1424 [Oceaniovalibus guishaninsula JLT2003]
MAQTGLLRRLAIGGARPRRRAKRPVLDAYRGYGVPGGCVLRGRVLAALRRTTPDPDQSRWQNLREMASLFFTDEVADVRVTVPATGAEAVSDSEGYVTLEMPFAAPPGWHELGMEIAGDPTTRTVCRVLIPSPDARIGVISDIDDTVMLTGAYSLARNLWTTFTGSAITRKVFPDAVVLLDHLSAHGVNPVYYVSSSPWNLHAFLNRVFDRAGLVAGPVFLRDLGIGGPAGRTRRHGDHKGDAIDRIMDANPALPFVLIGDTGQHDAEIYLEAAHRHGGRVRAVILREPRPEARHGPDEASRVAMAALKRIGVTVIHAPDFAQVAGDLRRAGIVV